MLPLAPPPPLHRDWRGIEDVPRVAPPAAGATAKAMAFGAVAKPAGDACRVFATQSFGSVSAQWFESRLGHVVEELGFDGCES